MSGSQQVDVLPETLAICRLAADAPIPAWATLRPFFAVVRTQDELSIMCPAAVVPDAIDASRHWRAMVVRGPFGLDSVGILASLAAPLAGAGVSIMPVATFDTDYILVAEAQLPAAIDALRTAGHRVS